MKIGWNKHALEFERKQVQCMEQVLRLGGYEPHEVIFKGELHDSWIREITSTKRFHAYTEGRFIQIHFDVTKNGKHKLSSTGNLNEEVHRLKAILNKIKPKEVVKKSKLPKQPPKEKRLFKNAYAPNLLELQRNMKQNDLSPVTLA